MAGTRALSVSGPRVQDRGMGLEAHFSGLLDAKGPDLELGPQAWDRRANEVGGFSIDADDAVLHTVLRHHRLAGERVLEINFGGGRHLAELARRVSYG